MAVTDRRRAVLASAGEIATDEALAEVAERLGYRVFPKLRIADALDINPSGLSDEQFHYALSAHFDFVVGEADTSRSLFAVEFDGRQHDTSRDVAARDRLKDEICAKLELPLLRIDTDFLKQVDRFTIVGYLIEVHGLAEAFYEQQRAGYIAWDDDFDYWCAVGLENGRVVQPYDLAAPAKRLIAAMHTAGEIDDWTYSHATRFAPAPETKRHVAYVWLKARDDEWLFASAAIRTFDFPGIGAWDIAEQLAARALHQRLLRYRAGEDVVISGRELDERVQQTTGPGWGHGGILRHVDVPGLRSGSHTEGT